MTDLITNGPKGAPVTVILAHGAGAPMDSPFMEYFADGIADVGIADVGIACVRFEFPYMVERRVSGKKRPPNTMSVLLQAWQDAINAVKKGNPDTTLIIGGKSMGGRVASMLASEAGMDGLVCLGYPFHPAGRPEKLRVDHLLAIKTPALFIQGTRDALGNRDEVASYRLSDAIKVHWLEDGDHNFKPRKASGRTEDQNWREGVDALVAFAQACAQENGFAHG